MAVVDAYRPEVARRASYHCEYCYYPEAASSTPLEVDHIILEAKVSIGRSISGWIMTQEQYRV